MKTIHIFFLSLLLICCQFAPLQAQSPEAINYQGVARDANNVPLINQSISLQISILAGTPSSPAVYQEVHTLTTTDLGLFALEIGSGTVGSGTFAAIDWGNDLHFVQVEMDVTGGTNYQLMGTSQLVSVPYALHAKTAENTFSGDYADLTNTPIFPTLVSSFTNDAGYITSPDDADADPANELQDLDEVLTQGNDAGTQDMVNVGNIGIGTTTPVAELEVIGLTKTDALLVTDSASGTDVATITSNAGNGNMTLYRNGMLQHDLQADATTVFNEQGRDINFRVETDNSQYAFLVRGDNDRVGIGTSTPDALLHVAGRTRTNTFQMTSGAGNNLILTSDANGIATWQAPATSPVTGAANGLNLNGSLVELGGVLTQSTSVQLDTADLTFDIDNTGNLLRSSNNITHYEANASGNILTGGNTFWKEDSTTGASIARIRGTNGNGNMALFRGGNLQHEIQTSGTTVFNEQGSDINFRIETDNETYAFLVRGDNDRVGIGTSTPGSQLHVAGKTQTNNFQMTNGAGANKVLTSDANGNATWETPVAAPVATASNGLTLNGTQMELGGSLDAHTTLSYGPNDLNFDLDGNGDFKVQIDGTDHFRINNGGNILLAGETTFRKDSTSGTDLCKISSSSGNGVINVYNGGSSQHQISGNGKVIFNQLSLDKDFQVKTLNLDQALFVDASTDRVGIGTSTPASQFHVSADDATAMFTLTKNINNKTWAMGFGNQDQLAFTHQGTVVAFIGTNGSYNSISDSTYKTNVASLPTVMDQVLQLRPVNYHFKADTVRDRKSYGFIAQEVQLLFPDLVKEFAGGKIGLDYQAFAPVAIKAIQELNTEVQELKNAHAEKDAAIQALTAQLANLSARMEQVEASVDQKQPVSSTFAQHEK